MGDESILDDLYKAGHDAARHERDYDPRNTYEWERVHNELRVLRYERDVARAKFDRAVKILVGIHNLINPSIQEVDGKRYQFRSPIIEEQMQALSDRIRAIPDELAVVDAAGG